MRTAGIDWENAPRLDVLYAAMVREKEKQMTFKVTESGWYRTRDGRLAEVLFNKYIDYVPGFFENSTILNQWDRDGRHAFPYTPVTDPDLVEYLGKERPKQNKVVRMAPALIKEGGNYFVTGYVYHSAESANLHYPKEFIRWLIDSHGIDVEVPDNG